MTYKRCKIPDALKAVLCRHKEAIERFRATRLEALAKSDAER